MREREGAKKINDNDSLSHLEYKRSRMNNSGLLEKEEYLGENKFLSRLKKKNRGTN